MIFARVKLASVGTGSMAVHAFCESDRLFEISVGVAFHAIHIGMLTEQGKFRLRMIELLIRGHRFPPARGVASVAGLPKRAVVRIAVAVRARCKGNAREPRRPARSRGHVTFFAWNFRVESGKRELCLAVIEILCSLPVHEVVALRAVRAKLPLVRILVARGAYLGQAQECVVQILHLNQRLGRLLYVRRSMALLAVEPCVLAFERVACLAVIESF